MTKQENNTTHVLPAQPKFELLMAYFDDDDNFYCMRQPIIGWRITPDGTEPIVIDGYYFTEKNKNMHGIKCPDGQVLAAYEDDDNFSDEVAWMAEMEASHKRGKEWEREKALKAVKPQA